MTEARQPARLGAAAVVTALLCVVLTPLSPFMLGVLAASMDAATRLGEQAEHARLTASIVFALPPALYALATLALLLQARRLPIGYPGRRRDRN